MAAGQAAGLFAELLQRLIDSGDEERGKRYQVPEVARATGFSASYLRDLLSGKRRNPGRDVIAKLAAYFQVDPGYFFPDATGGRADAAGDRQPAGEAPSPVSALGDDTPEMTGDQSDQVREAAVLAVMRNRTVARIAFRLGSLSQLTQESFALMLEHAQEVERGTRPPEAQTEAQHVDRENDLGPEQLRDP